MHTPPIRLDAATTGLLFLLALVWGGSFFLAEIALRALPPFTLVLLRTSLALPVLLVALRLHNLRMARGWAIWRTYAVMGVLNNAIPFSLIFWGQTQISSGLAAILNGTTALFGVVVAALVFVDERFTAHKLGGAVLGLLGVAVIIGPDALRGVGSASLGQVAILGAALSYALASAWARRHLGDQPPLMNAFGMLSTSTVIMLPIVLLTEGVPQGPLPGSVWAAVLALAVVSTALAYQLYFAILPRAGSANLMLVTLLIPPCAIALGALFLGEQLTPEAWIGFAIIAAGLLITDGRVLRR
ncbi:DMT family transporter [Cognatishimia sp. F0-27]|uniref:DMT family transporter n=1 Tax=Cognatishimia sp. F0-27 TaxID=2816855 RepID=UPI001D0C37B6|nr:DMT family transporter [Cognatishimia sp. F0-27]MCC1491131.1 DMT family transporter [Cognatishimia sp. F0-27]